MLPRRLVPGQIHAVTRRVRDRTFLLRPGAVVNQIVMCSLGVALERHAVDLYALLAESNHVHSLPGDRGGESSALPDFHRDFHCLVARALNAHYGRGENFWRVGSYDNVEIHDQRSLEEQLLYLWSNPVKDGLVERPEDWPGVKFLPEDLGRTFTVERPDEAFFGGRLPDAWEPTDPPARRAHRRARRVALREERRQRSLRGTRPGARPPKQRAPRPEPENRRDRRTLPERVTFQIAVPPGYEHMSLEEVRAHFRRLLDARVALIHEQRRAEGHPLLSPQRRDGYYSLPSAGRSRAPGPQRGYYSLPSAGRSRAPRPGERGPPLRGTDRAIPAGVLHCAAGAGMTRGMTLPERRGRLGT